MSHEDQIALKRRQIHSLKDVEVIDEARAANIAKLESELRALEGNADDPRDGKIVALEKRVAELEAGAPATALPADLVEKAADVDRLRSLHDRRTEYIAGIERDLDQAKREKADAEAALAAEREAHAATKAKAVTAVVKKKKKK